MYELLKHIASRPEPFSQYTAKELWTRPHLAKQMLNYHLSQQTDLASRTTEFIDHAVDWIDSQVHLDGKRVCDLGCGPGLYTQRFAALGAQVTGVDFSGNSLEYARAEAARANLAIHYLNADYLSDDLPAGFDVITLIYTDLCALSPKQRSALLKCMRGMLDTNGRIVLDVASVTMLEGKQELTILEERLMGGFWAKGNYVGIQKSHVYPEEHVSLDHYLIVEPNETWEIYNWFQYFTPTSLEAEMAKAGFVIQSMNGGICAEPLTDTSPTIGIIASAS